MALEARVEFDLSDGGAFEETAFEETAFKVDGYVDVSDEVDGDVGLDIEYGIKGNAPMNRAPDAGTLDLAVLNEDGRYSPNHANCRTGFKYEIGVRVYLEADGVPQRGKFVGRIYLIDPPTDVHGVPLSRITAHDVVYEMEKRSVRSIPPQVNKTEAELIQAVIDACPAVATPVAVDLDAGIDTYPIAFDNLEKGVKVRTVITKPVISAWGKWFVKGDGTLCYRTRISELAKASAYTFTDDEIVSLSAPATLDQVLNWVKATVHPKELDASDTEELYASQTVITIQSGEMVPVYGDYRDPLDTKVKIGGIDFQDPLVAGTDFKANTAADGSGANITADITIVESLWGASFKLEITNANAGTAYLVDATGAPFLKVRGRPVRDIAPTTFESKSGAADRDIDIDLEYQDDANVAQALAEYVRSQNESPKQVNEFSFNPHVSDALMQQAIEREPGDVVMVTNQKSGLIEVSVLIHRIRMKIQAGPMMMLVTYGVAPKLVGDGWTLDESELDDTTIVGHG